MIRGSCLCGGVEFEIEEVVGPFELCHCSKCRKVSGSAFMAAVVVSRVGFHFVKGVELVKIFVAPVIKTPPGYRSVFCGVCGSPVPDPTDTSPRFEVAAGTLDGDPGLRPDKHIFTDVKSLWFSIADDLPQMDIAALRLWRVQNKSHDLTFSKAVELNVNIAQAFDLISDGKVFELTGASSVAFDFVEGGAFKLDFESRGSISGQFKRIDRPATVDMSWKVRGFNRAKEDSRITFSLKPSGERRTIMEVKHLQILSQESLDAKAGAWTEILNKL